MNKDASQQPPPFARDCQPARVAEPLHQLLPREILERIASVADYHAEKYRYVDAKKYLGEGDRGFTAPNDPGRTHHRLPRVVRKFAALRGFVLHAPLADLLAEGKPGKLSSTSNAICHGFLKRVLKRVSAVWCMRRGVKGRGPKGSGLSCHSVGIRAIRAHVN